MRLKELGLEVKTGVGIHGIVAMLKASGNTNGRCVAVRADMDALPIVEAGDKPYRSETHGVMHACGHDVHMTCALGVAELLSKHRDQLKGDVKFLFQPAEEAMPATYVGDWGAKLMVAEVRWRTQSQTLCLVCTVRPCLLTRLVRSGYRAAHGRR